MIAVRLQGRLGNQLFQYAFIMAASKQLNTSFYIDQYIELSSVDNYFNHIAGSPNKALMGIFKIKGFKNIFNFRLRRLYYKYLAQINKLSVYEYDYTCSISEVIIKDHSLYLGFFFSELFFKPFEDTIKRSFTLKAAFVNKFKDKYEAQYKNNAIVTVHIRRTDYQNLHHLNLGADDLSLPLSYYKKALAEFDGQSVHFIFISDDTDFVHQNFKDVKNKTISTEDEITDFQHLLNADACIISNSTFSWWGAFLNPKKEKVVYCPKYYLGFYLKQQIPQYIYPKEWRQIEFI